MNKPIGVIATLAGVAALLVGCNQTPRTAATTKRSSEKIETGMRLPLLKPGAVYTLELSKPLPAEWLKPSNDPMWPSGWAGGGIEILASDEKMVTFRLDPLLDQRLRRDTRHYPRSLEFTIPGQKRCSLYLEFRSEQASEVAADYQKAAKPLPKTSSGYLLPLKVRDAPEMTGATAYLRIKSGASDPVNYRVGFDTDFIVEPPTADQADKYNIDWPLINPERTYVIKFSQPVPVSSPTPSADAVPKKPVNSWEPFGATILRQSATEVEFRYDPRFYAAAAENSPKMVLLSYPVGVRRPKVNLSLFLETSKKQFAESRKAPSNEQGFPVELHLQEAPEFTGLRATLYVKDAPNAPVYIWRGTIHGESADTPVER